MDLTPITSFVPIWLLLLLPVFILGIWQLNTVIAPPPAPPPTLQNKRIILLIAHPDDESMFFSPTVLGLSKPSLGNHIKILCLSSGNADGLGETRKKELESAALSLGIRKREDVFVIDDQARFKDGMKEQWSEADIANVLAQAFAPDALTTTDTKGKKAKKPNKDGPRATIDALITFDGHGVSSHPNHISLYHGARLFLSNLMQGYDGYACPVTLYVLPTVNLLRKYSFILDVLPTYLAGIGGDIVAGASGKKTGSRKRGISKGAKGDKVLFVNDLPKYMKARDAMVNGHKSQMVWFRWAWIAIGRYMVINDLRKEYVV